MEAREFCTPVPPRRAVPTGPMFVQSPALRVASQQFGPRARRPILARILTRPLASCKARRDGPHSQSTKAHRPGVMHQVVFAYGGGGPPMTLCLTGCGIKRWPPNRDGGGRQEASWPLLQTRDGADSPGAIARGPTGAFRRAAPHQRAQPGQERLGKQSNA